MVDGGGLFRVLFGARSGAALHGFPRPGEGEDESDEFGVDGDVQDASVGSDRRLVCRLSRQIAEDVGIVGWDVPEGVGGHVCLGIEGSGLTPPFG